MPLFAPEQIVGSVKRMDVVEGTYGLQVEMEITLVGDEESLRMVWLSIPDRGITTRTILGQWLLKTTDVERRLDGLDFRANRAGASLAQVAKFLVGNYFAFESMQLGGNFTQEAKERWVPVRKFKNGEEALAFDVESKSGSIDVSSSSAPESGIPEDVMKLALTTWVATGKNEAAIRGLAGSSWPGVDADELVAALKAS